MKTKRLFFALLLLGVITACSMNGKQEATLNTAKLAYIEARNTNKVSMVVKLTYADAVRYYQKEGDDAFKERFRPENNQAYFQKGIIKDVESSGKFIHVQFEFEMISENDLDFTIEPAYIYAISIDDGVHWKFLDKKEYDNPKIIPAAKKLIKS